MKEKRLLQAAFKGDLIESKQNSVFLVSSQLEYSPTFGMEQFLRQSIAWVLPYQAQRRFTVPRCPGYLSNPSYF
jgi:hypothetical protein